MYKLKQISVKRIKGNSEDKLHAPVHESDYNQLISESCIINLEGQKPIIYLNETAISFKGAITNLNNLKLSLSNRKSLGTNNYSVLVGGLPKKTNRSSFCNQGALVIKDQLLNNTIMNLYSQKLYEIFKNLLPQWWKIGEHFFDKTNIHPDYIMGNTCWTSAIINKNSAHNYHYDTSNLKYTYSALVALKDQVSGGYLVLPEYGLALKTTNESVTFFCGKDILHGVSPIVYHMKSAYRYSLVYYTVEDLKHCQSLQEEFDRN